MQDFSCYRTGISPGFRGPHGLCITFHALVCGDSVELLMYNDINPLIAFCWFNSIDPASDPCTPCPIERRDIMRTLCQRGHIPMAQRLALGKAKKPDKYVRILVSGLHTMKQKSK